MLGDPGAFRGSRITSMNARPSAVTPPAPLYAPPPPVPLPAPPAPRERTTLTDVPRTDGAIVPGVIASSIGALGAIGVLVHALTATQGSALDAILGVVMGLLLGGGILAVARARAASASR